MRAREDWRISERVVVERERERDRQTKRTERGRDEGRKRELEGSNRTSKLNVEIRVECLVR